MIEITALLIGTITTFLIALTVILKNNKNFTNILFVGMAFSLIGWSASTYVSLHTNNDAQTLAWFRPIMFFVVLQNTFFFLLVKVFPYNDHKVLKSKRYIFAIIYSIMTALIALSPFLFKDFKNGSPIPGPGMVLFLPHALIFAVGGIFLLIRRYVRSKGVEKAQLQYFLAGTVLLYTLVPVGNFIVPVLFKINLFVTLSPLYSIVFSSLFVYGIIAKKLFDIRAAVARSVAYVLSLGFIGFVYGVVIYLISSSFNFEGLSKKVQIIFYVTLAIFTAVLYPSIKSFFARITTKIFYQDAYDPQELLDQLNKILVSRVDLEPLLKDISDLIESNIKADYCVFTIRESAYYPARTIGTKSKQFSTEDAKVLHDLTPKIHHRVLITDELGEEQADLKDVLSKYDVSVLARLVSTVKLDVEGIGYLVLGPKKSGNIYSKQDEDILRIIANELVIAIENALKFEEIQKFNETLQEKIETATRQLRTTNEKLKQLDETKDEFISMASHQLRTPLTSVKGYLSMVLEGDAGDVSEMQHKLLNQAFVSSQRMVYLIADLLNVSRLRTGKFIIDAVATNLADVIEGESTQLKITATAKGLELNFNKPENFPTYMLDETKIRQVIMNFMDNAIYYTPKGGKIEVELKETDNKIEYTVSDNGIGVPKAELHHLFTKFYRAANAKKSRPDGTGLGLFMAKKVIVAQGGSIVLKSEEGKGSTFGFEFDKSKLQTPKDANSTSEI